jgi:hypothetical protein
MKVIVVLTFDLSQPEQIADVLDALNPPGLPFFAGQARIALDPVASAVTDWLDAPESKESDHA